MILTKKRKFWLPHKKQSSFLMWKKAGHSGRIFCVKTLN
jgi:hypothetical protein